MATQASVDLINLMYVAYYGRPGDPDGVEFWADVVDVNGGVMSQEILNAFGTSAEFTDRFGSLTNEELVNQLFNFMFGRDADPEGLEFWVGELESGNRTLVDIALAIAEGAQNEDAVVLANKVNVAGYYTEQVAATFADYEADDIDSAAAILGSVTDSPISVVVAKQDVDEALANQGGTAQEFNLTTGVDTVNVTEDFAEVKGVVLPGGSSTYSFGDDIQGNETTTLKLTVGGTGTADLAEVSDVGEIEIVNGVGGGGTTTFNGTLWDNIGLVRLEGGADGLNVELDALQLGTALAIDDDVSGTLDVDFTTSLSAELWAHRNSSIVWDNDIGASVAMGEQAGAWIYAPSEDISIGNVIADVAASGEFELTVSATGAGDDVSVGDISIAISGDGSASADIEIDGGDTATAGNIDVVGTGEDVEFSFSISADAVTVGDVNGALSGTSSDFWFYAYGTNGAGDLAIGDISVTNDSMITDDSDTSVSVENSSGDVSIGNVSFLGGNDLNLEVENWGDGSDDVTLGDVDVVLGASGDFSFTVSNTNDASSADGGAITVGDVTVDAAEDSYIDLEVENTFSGTGATTDLTSGALTVGDIDLSLGADASGDLYIGQYAWGGTTDTVAVGATTVGNVDLTLGIGASFDIDLDVENTASGDVGPVSVGNVGVSGDDGSDISYSASVSASNGDITSVEVGDIDVALGVSGSIDELYTYIRALSGDILSVDLGSVSIELAENGYGESISTDIWADSGDVASVSLGDVNIDLATGASITWASTSIWAGSGDVDSVSIGDLTVNLDASSTLDDYEINIWATSGTIDTVTVGNVNATVGANADFDDYEFQAWATNMVNAVTLGDVTAVVEEGGSFSYSATVSASGDIGSFTVGNIDLTANNISSGSLELDIHAFAWSGDIGSLNVGDISIAATEPTSTADVTDSFVGIEISNTASGDAGEINVGDIDVDVSADATVSIDIDSFGGTNDADVNIGNLDIAGAGVFTLAIGQDVATASLDYTGDVTIGDITVSTGGSNDLGIGGATDILAGVVTVGGMVTLGDIDYSAYGASASIDVSGYDGVGSIVGSAFADMITDNDGTNSLTGGAGADVFSFVGTNANTTEATADEVTDFVSGLDTIQIDTAAGVFTADTYFEGTYASFADFMAGAATQMTSAPEDNLVAGQVGNDVFLAIDLDDGDAVDTVIKLTGVDIGDLNFADYDFV